MATTTQGYLQTSPMGTTGCMDDDLLRLYALKAADVRRSVKCLYDELSYFESFEAPCNFVLDMFPGLQTVYQYSALRCLHLDIIEPLGDRLLTYSGNSYTREIIGRSSFQYHIMDRHFVRIPKMMYDRVIASETYKLRGFPMIEQAVDSLTIGGKLYLFGTELEDSRLLVTGSSARMVEYTRLR